MSYAELAERLNRILDERREISTSRYGLVAARGHEEEHDRLTKEAEEIRRQMRRARYDTDE